MTSAAETYAWNRDDWSKKPIGLELAGVFTAKLKEKKEFHVVNHRDYCGVGVYNHLCPILSLIISDFIFQA